MPKSEASYLISFLIAFKSVDRYFVDVFPDHGPRIKEACGATVKPDAVSVRMLLLLCIFQLALFLLRSPSSCCLSSMRLDVQPCYCGYNFFFGTLRDLSLSRSFLARGSLAINLWCLSSLFIFTAIFAFSTCPARPGEGTQFGRRRFACCNAFLCVAAKWQSLNERLYLKPPGSYVYCSSFGRWVDFPPVLLEILGSLRGFFASPPLPFPLSLSLSVDLPRLRVRAPSVDSPRSRTNEVTVLISLSSCHWELLLVPLTDDVWPSLLESSSGYRLLNQFPDACVSGCAATASVYV